MLTFQRDRLHEAVQLQMVSHINHVLSNTCSHALLNKVLDSMFRVLHAATNALLITSA